MQTVAEESRAQGNIGVSLYVKYLRAGANILVLLLVILVNILAQVRKKPKASECYFTFSMLAQ